MSEETRTLTYEQLLPVPPAEVYRAFTNSTALREWLCDVATTDPKPGGRVYLAWNNGYYTAGHFVELREPEAAAFVWRGRGEAEPTMVNVAISPAPTGSRLRLEHSGIGMGEDWDRSAAEFDRGWRHFLENLTSVLSTGEDIRFTRRPMLGIFVGEFDPEIAAELGVPVGRGVRLDGVDPRRGAAAAGLQQDDIVVRIGDRETVDWPSLQVALQPHRAGDTVEVEFYRGAEKRTTQMTLSGRDIPPIPPTGPALADVVRARHADDQARLAAFLDGISEAEAAYKPAPDEWSVREVLAHMIHGERYSINWVGELLGGQEGWHDDWAGNIHLTVAATAAAFPTVGGLFDELKRLHAELASALAGLPPSFVARKSSYWRLAYNMVDASYSHTDIHLTQMRAAVAAAKEHD